LETPGDIPQIFTHHLEQFNEVRNLVAQTLPLEMCRNYLTINQLYWDLLAACPELTSSAVQQAEKSVAAATRAFYRKLGKLLKRQQWAKDHNKSLRKRDQRTLDEMQSRTHLDFKPLAPAELVKKEFKINYQNRTLALSVCGHMRNRRVVCRFSMNKYDRALLELPGIQTRQAKLVRTRSGRWQFHLTIARQVSAPSTEEVARRKKLGIDLGVKNHVATSTGLPISAEKSAARLTHIRKVDASFQSKGTKSSRRKLIKRRGYYSRYLQDVQHCVARDITNEALKQNCLAIIAEKLEKVNQPRAAKGHALGIKRWAYKRQLEFIYRAAVRKGLAVYTVLPAHTSDTCPHCGWSHPLNRVERDTFRCTRCGYTADADINAAVNIVAKFDKLSLIDQCKSRYRKERYLTGSL
jgi:IS605 OrfB family transposase